MVFRMYMYTVCRYVQWSFMQCVYMCNGLSYVQVYSVYFSFVSTLIYLSCSHRASTRWRRLIGCLKVQIIFHPRATKYRSLLQKITYTDKASYHSTPPCNSVYIHVYRVCISFVWTWSFAYTCLYTSIPCVYILYMYTCVYTCIPCVDIKYMCTYMHTVCVYIFRVNMVFRVITNNYWPRWLLTYTTLTCITLIYDFGVHHYNIYHSSYHFHMYHVNIYITTTAVVVRICIPSERKKETTASHMSHLTSHFQKAVVSPKDFRSFFLSRPLYTYALSQTCRLLLPNYCAQYGVATISRLLKIIGLLCKRAVWKRLSSAQETYHFNEPTNRSHSIVGFFVLTRTTTVHISEMKWILKNLTCWVSHHTAHTYTCTCTHMHTHA